MHINSYIKEEERFISNRLILYVIELQKDEKLTPKLAERNNITADINET